LDILSRSGDIGKVGHCKKSTEILHVFSPNTFRGATPNFWTLFGDSSQILITWQSFAAIGRGISEMWMSKKKKKKHHG